MKIGVDLRVLQVGHQYRGIGEVAKQCLDRLFARALQDPAPPSFVFYRYDDEIDPKAFIRIPKGLVYEEVVLGPRPRPDVNRGAKAKLIARWRSMFGHAVPHAGRCDVLVQFDYALGVPRRPRTVLIAHDLIPYIFWNDYFTSPWVHFKHRAARTTLRTMLNNLEYRRVLKRSHRSAWKILCVSDHTRRDLKKYLHVPERKMTVMRLGVSRAVSKQAKVKRAAHLPTKPFLLFIGALDPRRRRVDDIVAAFNNLKAEGHDIQLVLVGENFQAKEGIPSDTVRRAVMESSYGDDILTLGYVDDATKQRLYNDAIAFVFPTIYEGFGIPILEAMLFSCPVITYRNSSIPEVGGAYAHYASDWTGIQRQVEELLAMPDAERQQSVAAARRHAEAFTWDATADTLYAALRRTKRA